MSNWVIVAIPSQDDYVWKISSEKVPHMTILNLGEHDNGPQAAKITSYLEHAAKLMLHTFGMSTLRRDTLGPKEADVLLFDKSYCGEELKTFRDALLKSPDILDLYNGEPQFPEWTPHLTLGYPESPAAPDERDYPGVNWVNFDRIAFWINDYDGPEFNLSRDDTLAMADMGGPTPSVSNVAWSKYKKSDYSVEQWHNACLIHQHDGAPDSKSQCKLPVRTPDGTLNRKGVQAAAAALAGARGGVNASEDEIAKAKASLRSLYKQLGDDAPDILTHGVMEMDEEALVAFIAQKNGVMPGDILHFGVKGMKWGVRKDRAGGGPANVPPRINREAKKDAEEFTKAKLFYGEGAGNRRKLIKAKVEQKSKMSADYKRAFDHHVANTDLNKRANQAVRTRRVKDVKKSTGRTARGIKNIVVGNPQATTVAALGIVAGAKMLKDSGIPQKLATTIAKMAQDRRNHQAVNDLLNGMGIRHDDTTPVFLHMLTSDEIDELMHFGVKGMKWGVRKDDRPSSISPRATDTATTKKVKTDYNNLSDKEFSRKYATSKATYAKRVAKAPQGDPYRARSDRLKSAEAKKTAKRDNRKNDSGSGSDAPQTQRQINRANTKAAKAQTKAAVKMAKKDATFSKDTNSFKTLIDIHNAAAKDINENSIARINGKAKYKNADFTKDSPLRRQYYKEYQQAHLDALKKAANSMHSPSGKLMYDITSPGVNDGATPYVQWDITVGEVEHAFSDKLSFRPVFDVDGYVVRFEPEKDELQQGIGVDDGVMLDMLENEDELVHVLQEEGLELFHFGVKGMKWGVRRARGADGRVHGDASPDAKDKVDLTAKVKKGGGVHVLSNQELNRLNNRLNLETNYARLVAEKSNLDKAQSTVKKSLALGKSANEAVKFAKSPVGKALIAMMMGKGGKVAVNKLKG